MQNFDDIHSKIIKHQDDLQAWLNQRRETNEFPIYTSVDIRDSGNKIASVDANIFPAGFNNICEVDRNNGPEVANFYLSGYYGEKAQKIALVTEEHTKNAYYWENVFALKSIIEGTGRELRLCFPREMESIEVESVHGNKMNVYGSKADSNGDLIVGADFKAELVISNNDFSDDLAEWGDRIQTPINPPRELGWHSRKKSTHFEFYNHFAKEFSEILGLSSNHFTIQTEQFQNFDISDEESRKNLAKKADIMIEEIKKQYSEAGIDDSPSLFIKNDSGTYGLGVTHVESGEDILNWNNKVRKKMKATKGGGKIENLILQEGIPSKVLDEEGSSAEPVLYTFGCQLLGGFLRTHGKKGPRESLNSPGAVYKRLCVSDLMIDSSNSPLENVYGWISRISSFAITEEIKRLELKIKSS
ncbi:MAG: glutamate--cysteine ligase [Bdellovibrionales bacterium]